jgi:hypothetical protein
LNRYGLCSCVFLLKRKVGVLFGVLRGPSSGAPLFKLVMVLYHCDVYLFPFCCVLCLGSVEYPTIDSGRPMIPLLLDTGI